VKKTGGAGPTAKATASLILELEVSPVAVDVLDLVHRPSMLEAEQQHKQSDGVTFN
jgi:hypothetical protein